MKNEYFIGQTLVNIEKCFDTMSNNKVDTVTKARPITTNKEVHLE